MPGRGLAIALSLALWPVSARRLGRVALQASVIAGGLAAWPASGGTGDLDASFADHGRLTPVAGAGGSAVFVDSDGSSGILVGGSDLDYSGSLFNLNGMGCTFRAHASSFIVPIGEQGAMDPANSAVKLPDIEAVSMVRQADGKVVGIGHKVQLVSSYRCSHSFTPAVFRFNSDGSPDTAIGLNGTREWHVLNTFRSLALDSRGRVVIAGTRWADDDDPATPGRHELAVMRLRPDGKLDRTFGADGYYFGPEVDRTLSVYFRGRYDGMDKINLVRTGTNDLRIAVQSGGVCQIVAVTADGTPDSAFGSEGVATPRTAQGAPVTCHALKSDPDGRLVVAGNSRKRGFLGRLFASGEPDPAFTADPAISRSMTRVTSVASANDGNWLVAGTGTRGASIARLQSTGSRDPAFGDAGLTWLYLDSDSAPILAVHDMAVRDDGTVFVVGSHESSDSPFVARLLGDGGGTSQGVLSFSKWHAAALESDDRVVVRVRRAGGSDGEVSVRFSTLAGDAVAQEDFVPRSGRLHWAAGDRSEKAVAVDMADEDRTPERLESFHVVLDNIRGGAGFGTRRATVDIQPDGHPGGQIELDMLDLDVGENGDGQVILLRNHYYQGRVCATLTAKSGSAKAGLDFNADPIVVCWEDGEEEWKLPEIQVLDDNLREGIETFRIELSNPTGGAIIGPDGSATLTLYDND